MGGRATNGASGGEEAFEVVGEAVRLVDEDEERMSRWSRKRKEMPSEKRGPVREGAAREKGGWSISGWSPSCEKMRKPMSVTKRYVSTT